ncbi:hypothetical protein Q7C_643 [Methylophaga frappieri]|uniref:Uncharacterized protein n=2 Tax=Methylophaga frappieri (strain ATCC BAA-2434 / DSM 25690 / JAM7) TaxID=754477 RepID=I1YFX1_METFJ|nr:hypothetical protein Q7C_643 [Methylophaga frappieri]
MDNALQRAASQPHERFLLNLALSHFLLPAILFATKNLWLIFTLPVFISTMVIASLAWQASRPAGKSDLVLAHWQLAWRRGCYLLLTYGLTALLFLISLWLTQDIASSPDQFIQRAVLGLFVLMPLSLILVVLLILETSALAQSRQGKMPSQMRL